MSLKSSKPRTPLTRRTRLSSGGKPLKPKKRKPSEFARIYGSKERVAWVKSLPCIACDGLSAFFGRATQGTCHNAHTVTGGIGRKADCTTIVPLCSSHHRRYDEYKPPFDIEEAREGLQSFAPIIERLWLAHVASQGDV